LAGIKQSKKLDLKNMTKQQLIRIIKQCRIDLCECCSKPQPLIRHHWFEEQDQNHKYHSKLVCLSCNSKLLPRNFYGNDDKGTYILPDWETQCRYVRSHYTYGLGSTPFCEYLRTGIRSYKVNLCASLKEHKRLLMLHSE